MVHLPHPSYTKYTIKFLLLVKIFDNEYQFYHQTPLYLLYTLLSHHHCFSPLKTLKYQKSNLMYEINFHQVI